MGLGKEYRLMISLGARVQNSFGGALGTANKQLAGFSAAMLKTAAIGAAAFAAIKAGQFISDAVKVYAAYEQQMAQTYAIMQATTEQEKALDEAAKAVGKTSTKSATDGAAALEYMARAGWSAESAIAALSSVIHFAEAAQIDLETSSGYITQTMASLKLTVQDLPRYLDILATTDNATSASAEELMQSYIGCAGTLSGLNVPIVESATALGILSQRGLKGSEAGTKLNSTILRLTSGVGEAGQMMKKLGISAYDENGKFIGLRDTLMLVENATAGMTDKQRTAVLAAIGGKTQIDTLLALMSGLNTVTADGTYEWDALSQELENSDGALTVLAKKMTNTLTGAASRCSNAVDTLKISLIEAFSPLMIKAVNLATSAINGMSNGISAASARAAEKLQALGASASSYFSETAGGFLPQMEKTWGNINAAAGEQSSIVKTIGTEFYKGFILQGDWFVRKVLPRMSNSMEGFSGLISGFSAAVAPAVSGLFESLGGAAENIMSYKNAVTSGFIDSVSYITGNIASGSGKNLAKSTGEVFNSVSGLVEFFTPPVKILKDIAEPLAKLGGITLGFLGTIMSEGTVAGLTTAFSAISNLFAYFTSGFKALNALIFEGDSKKAEQIMKDSQGYLLKALLSPFISAANALIGIANYFIDQLNNFNITIPDWVPVIGGKTYGLSEQIDKIDSIPGDLWGALPSIMTSGDKSKIEEVAADMKASRIGELLGQPEKSGSEPTFAPIINFYGSQGKEEIAEVSEYTYQKFKEFADEYARENKRTSMGQTTKNIAYMF